MRQLTLERPIVFFDLETTGVDPGRDRIVEISVLRIDPDGNRETRTRRINPECPIPPEATKIHGIGDDDVRDQPTFRQVARSLLDFLGDADLAGFNVRRFDAPLLDREFMDCDLDLRLEQRHVVDAMAIYHRKERRDLSAAVRFYLERELEGAHSAEADVEATAAILEAQLQRYEDLPLDVESLDQWARRWPDEVDSTGRFRKREGEIVFNFGKHRGKPLALVARDQRDYLEWLMTTDLPGEARNLVRKALQRAPDQSA